MEGTVSILTIYVGESDHWHGKPLYAAIVELARERGLAGASVLRGVMGYGVHSNIHTTAILRLSEDLPMVIQVIDSEQKIQEFAAEVHPMVAEGLILISQAQAITGPLDPTQA